MPSTLIENKLGMYTGIRDFGQLHAQKIECKHAKSLTSRFNSHNEDLDLMLKMRAMCLEPESRSTIDKLNTRAQAIDLALQIAHSLTQMTGVRPEDQVSPAFSVSIDEANMFGDMEFHNYINAFLAYIKSDGNLDLDKLPASLITELEAANDAFFVLLEKTALDNMDKKRAGAVILRGVQRMDERLHILDVLMANFISSDPGFYYEYMRARGHAQTAVADLTYIPDKTHPYLWH